MPKFVAVPFHVIIFNVSSLPIMEESEAISLKIHFIMFICRLISYKQNPHHHIS